MVNSAYYSEMLCNKLNLVIWSQCQGQLPQGIVWFYDTACLHPAAHTVQTLQQLGFEEYHQTVTFHHWIIICLDPSKLFQEAVILLETVS
jgi:hypothetical protein